MEPDTKYLAYIGKHARLGKYPRKDTDEGSPADLDWTVMKLRRDAETGHLIALLLAGKVLDVRRFDDDGSAEWTHCSLRAWLNGPFFRDTFTDGEKRAILCSDLLNADEESCSRDAAPCRLGVPFTGDRVFLLSAREAAEFFSVAERRDIRPAPYAVGQGAPTSGRETEMTGAWWLRSPKGYEEGSVPVWREDGTITGSSPSFRCGVRPALWLDLDEIIRRRKYDAEAGDWRFAALRGFRIEKGTLICYTGSGGMVTVPGSVDCIGEEAFALCEHVTSVILPESVEYIADGAFRGSGITSVELPGHLIRIGERAFEDTPLTGIVIPDTLKRLDANAFRRAGRLKSAVLPRSLAYVEPGLFRQCTALEEIEIPEGVRSIGEYAFEGCSALKRVQLPASLESIRNDAFFGCRSLESIVLPEGLRTIGPGAFAGCTAPEQIRVPKGVTVGEGAFAGTEEPAPDTDADTPGDGKTLPETGEEKPANTRKGPWTALSSRVANETVGKTDRPKLQANIWAHFDRISPAQRETELNHRLYMNGRNDGSGWASVYLMLDGQSARFRVSDIGASLDEFREFVHALRDGDADSFCWNSEPGVYIWKVQRRGNAVYVTFPKLNESVFLPLGQFLFAADKIRGSW